MNLRFSIVIPTYNRAHLLAKTLDSVLCQDFDSFELIIVDDGSTDNTEEVIQNLYKENSKVRYLKKVNGERGAARNYGLKHAKGEFVIFLDSDDLFRPNHLTVLNLAIEEKPNINIIAAKYYFDRNGKLYPSDLAPLEEGFHGISVVLKGNPFSCNFGVRRSYPGLIPFREEREFVIIEDWVFLVENLFYDKIFVVDQTTTVMIDHEQRSMRTDHSNVIKKRLYALDWLIANYQFSQEQQSLLKGYSYYFCSVHCYIDQDRQQGLFYFNKAKAELGWNKLMIALFLKLLAGKNLISTLFNRG